MAKDEKTVTKPTSVKERQVDEYTASMFKALGYEGELPDSIMKVYTEFKRVKDTLQPGRLSPEGFSTIVVLSKMLDGEIRIDAEKE